MSGNAQSTVASRESLDRKHEVSEKSVRNVLLVGGGAAFLLVVSLIVCGLTIHFLAQCHPMQQVKPLGIITAPNLQPLGRFPKPNLQIDDDRAERIALYAAQNAKLNSYGWVNRSNGIVHIPIDRAVDLILQRGLSARTDGYSQTKAKPLQFIQTNENPE